VDVKKNISIAAVVVLFLIVGYLGVISHLSNEDRLLAEFRQDILNGSFEDMYSASSKFLKGNVTEAEFESRMRDVVAPLKEYDAEIKLRRNVEEEKLIRSVRAGSEAAGSYEYFALVETGQEPKKAMIHIAWIREGLRLKLFDLSVGDSKVSVTNRINTLAGEPFIAGK